MPTPDPLSEANARDLDAQDPLAHFREEFFIPADTVYLDGNSLGLLSDRAERAVLDALQAWKIHGVSGWLDAEPAWFTLGESLGARMAPMMGASPESIVVTGTTTVNLHQMVATFYQPTDTRRKIVATALDFPSDVYALQSQIRLHGGDPERDLVLVPSRDGRTIAEDDLIAAFTDDVALTLLPTVLYRSGQLLDVPRLVEAAHAAGIVIGFDCAHSAGVLPHELDAWDVDFAFWCTYKYLNAGPGAVGALYIHPRHRQLTPALTGWWGYRKDRQFEMVHEWEGATGAGAYQVSTIPLLSSIALHGSLSIFDEAGIDTIREKSLAQTDYLIALVEGLGLTTAPYGYAIGTPLAHARRGGHVAIEHEHAAQISIALKQRGFIVDFRQPNVVRLAPIPLYTTYHDCWLAAHALREIIDTDAHLEAVTSGLVT